MIREAAVAGQFYSADTQSLRELIHSFQKDLTPRLKARGVIVPHAGYMYSGAITGEVYSTIELPKHFIILGPNHTGRGAAMSLHPAGGWRTPLGIAAINGELNQALLKECSLLKEEHTAHYREHSIEVHIPFLQVMLSEFDFAAISVGDYYYSHLHILGEAIARVVSYFPEPVLLISSTDMTHFESAEAALEKDRLAIDNMAGVDPKGLFETVRENDISMCGFAPTVSVLTACRDLGSIGGRLIRYANSGDVSGDFGHVVAYAGMVIL